MIPDIARRAYDHSFKLDPVIRSLLDTDFYKLLMLQLIWGLYRDVEVTFQVINRTTGVRLADAIEESELRAQLDHARTLRFTRREMVWLKGNSFSGRTSIFAPEFLDWLAGFRLPEYHLYRRDGQFVLEFSGPWPLATMWEIPALAIISELRARSAMRHMGRFALDVLYARAKANLWNGMGRLKQLDGLAIADFGTRRRHGFLWQRWCVEALTEALGPAVIGSSNVLHAMENDLEAIGTNGHELPMVLAALAEDDAALLMAPYRVLEDWRRYYGGNLLIILPDTFGTAAFLRHAPGWAADWTGVRVDSAPPIEGGEEIVRWWRDQGRDPRSKLLIFSDGLDVSAIESVHRHFAGRVRLSFGWGTNLTNDFVGAVPATQKGFGPISLVCKVAKVNGRPAVKLSDNPNKASGEAAEVARYLRVFGAAGHAPQPVLV